MSNWRLLLDRMLQGFSRLGQQSQPVPDWVLGGGTALMLFADHRLSRDIDAFIDDPQYLACLSPDVVDVWNCASWDRAAHYLKLKYPEGEIDFIVSGAISNLQPVGKELDLTNIRPGRKTTIQVDSPAEIALKKMHYRATMLKPRDIFDIAVVDKLAHTTLVANLHEIADKKNHLLQRLDSLNGDYLRAELAELDIQPGWEEENENCLEIVRSIIEQIPEPTLTP